MHSMRLCNSVLWLSSVPCNQAPAPASPVHVSDTALLIYPAVVVCPLQMCANCGVTSTRVWRVANAGLMCCNACGMFYQKHHQHRPEHLLAANRAKQDARQAAAAAESPLQDPEPCPSSSNGELQQNLCVSGMKQQALHP